ncbi:DNA-binding transcriptional regulator, MarR family [Ferrithrix thermotolerans DSM 19514]|jgi:DNA-binding MarR family transcriptional regulator|uniref:DNA-binding transcriptional regulator, MarR family n=1 Tax=Ferrithrix thermotolerans DSM 19514 TaxID=1121881 RepID=A0A1M4ULI3_9ACTN|nr:MarR family winged helix-turn-helix transcriptional regulator [Ferrithrix thermotolerans]SHE57579.1 DNA-binding transcriptional regulator, MarR family [Ferrithrix thermotolerans DSM 19514]
MTERLWLSQEQLLTWTNFLAASQLIEQRVDSQLRHDFDFSHSEYEILVRLSQAEDHTMRMGRLAQLTIINKSALTYKISNLSKKGLIDKVPCKDDARGLNVVLTKEGERLLHEIAPSHVKTVREVLIDQLSPTELEALHKISEKLLEQFSSTPQCEGDRALKLQKGHKDKEQPRKDAT